MTHAHIPIVGASKYAVAVILWVTANAPAMAQIVDFSAKPDTVFHTLKIGAGGFIHDVDIECDQGSGRCKGGGTTTKVARTDTYGAYWFNSDTANCGNEPASGCWQQLITATSFPDSLFPGRGASLGVYEIRIAPSNTQHFYMYGPNGYLYSSVNRGTTWIRTAFSPVAADPNDPVTPSFGPFMAVDPANENVLYVGTPSSGGFFTTNGGKSFTAISTSMIPAGRTPPNSNQGGGNLIAFDPTSVVRDGATQGIYICSYGTGVYHSGDGGKSWILTTSTPTTCRHMIVDQNGLVWLIDNANESAGNQALHKYSSGSWATVKVGNGRYYNSIAVDPSNPKHLIIGQANGGLVYSVDGGSSWENPNEYHETRSATDVPWLARTKEDYMSEGNIVFDPAQSNVLYFAEGIGLWYTNDPLTTRPAWVSQSAAIEQLVGNWIISPPQGRPILTAMDRPAFEVDSPAQQYPSNHSIDNNRAYPIIEGYSADWCTAEPGTVVLLARGVNGNEYSGISAAGGAYDTWTTFTSLGVPPIDSARLYSGGVLACSTPDEIVWEEGNNGGLWYTDNGGKSWSKSTAGLPQNDLGWHGGNFLDRQNVIADRATLGTFYAYNSGLSAPGIYKSSDGGKTFSRTAVARHFDNNDRYNAQMRAVPGIAGDFYYTSGNDVPNRMQHFYECTDRGIVSCSPVSLVSDVWSFGFGKARPGGDGYPTIFIYGEVSGTFGLWRSDDHHKSWTRLSGAFVNNSQDQVKVIEGDNNVYGTVYIGFAGSGFAYGAQLR